MLTRTVCDRSPPAYTGGSTVAIRKKPLSFFDLTI